MRLYTNFFRSGSQYTFKRQQKEGPTTEDHNLLVLLDFILVDAEEEDETCAESSIDTTSSKGYSLHCAENQAPNIPLTFRSDIPPVAICPSSNFLDLRATFPLLPLTRGVSNGAELCVGASFKGYLATLLVPSLWLILGSYVFVAIITYIILNLNKGDIVSEPINNVDIHSVPEIPACGVFISGTTLPTPEEVLKHTLKEYGHLSEPEQDDSPAFHHPPSSREPKPATLGHKGLKVAVQKDVDIMFRGTVPDSWMVKEHDPRETRSASWAFSAHTSPMNVIECSTPVFLPAQTQLRNFLPSFTWPSDSSIGGPINVRERMEKAHGLRVVRAQKQMTESLRYP